MAATYLRSIVLLLLFGFQLVWSINFQKSHTEIMNSILDPAKYDIRVRPTENPEKFPPTTVNVNMFLRMIDKIDDVKKQYHIQVTFRQQWMDGRLKYDNMGDKIKFIQLFEFDKIWTPDLFFSNENTGFINNLIKPNVYFRIFPDGNVLFSARISLVLGCPMNLKRFPFDRQVCSLRMASYGYTTDDVIFLWKQSDPVQIVKNLQIPGFTLEEHTTDYCNSKTNTGEYSCLKVDFLFSRELRYYLIQIFIPCIMLVHVTWFSFWLDIDAAMTRLFVTVGPLLVLFVMTSDFYEGIPNTSHSTNLDDFIKVSMMFMFAAIIEFAHVNYHWRQIGKKQRRATGTLDTGIDEENGTAFDMPLVNSPAETVSPSHAHSGDTGVVGYYHRWVAKLPKGPKKFDVISRLLFPITFTLYNVYFWGINLFF